MTRLVSASVDRDTPVSVVIPAFNAERTLADTLRSVRAQTHRALEILVVDDGSTDGTAAVAMQAAAEDPRIRLLRQDNAGVAAARNRAVAAARGRFVAPLDADDLWHPRKIALQLAVFAAAPAETGMVYGWSAWIDEEDRLVTWGECRSVHEGDVFERLLLGNFIGNSSAPLIRTGLLREVGGYDPSLRARDAQGCEDLQLYLALAALAPVAVVPAYLVGYRQHRSSMSRGVEAMLRSHRLVLDGWRERRPDLADTAIREGEANLLAWMGRRALRDDLDPVGFARHVAAALRTQPALLRRPWFRRLVPRDLLRWLVEGLLELGPGSHPSLPGIRHWEELLALPVEVHAQPAARPGSLRRLRERLRRGTAGPATISRVPRVS